jgi:hypothetical protein
MERNVDFLGCDLFQPMKKVAKIGLTSPVAAEDGWKYETAG